MVKVPCARCGKMLAGNANSLPAGQRTCQPCRKIHRTSLPARPRRTKERSCEVCGETYRYTHIKQRTCGRACGERLRREITGTLTRTCWPSCRVYTPECEHCGKLFTARSSRQKHCSTECLRKATSATTSARIMQRYHADASFRDQVIARSQARRADKLGLGDATITLTYLMGRDRKRCGICRKPVRAKRGPMRPSIDHIVPLSRGGTHELVNVQLSHYRCNLGKNNRGGGEQLLLVG